MQLLAIVLYSLEGEQRILHLNPGALNIITGESATGKSSILAIVDYCLGRSTVTISTGRIAQSVSWYACLLQLPGGSRAFVARPAPREGARSATQAMLELGDTLTPLPFAALTVNADADMIREQLGGQIGIEENRSVHHPSPGSQGLEAGLAHAALLCFQGQGEIANQSLLFHRQGEPPVAAAIKATLPYFLGATTKDQARKRDQLLIAERDLRRATTDLNEAERAANDVDARLVALVAEAYAAGLVSESVAEDRVSAVAILERLSGSAQAPTPLLDDESVSRVRELESVRAERRRQLNDAAATRGILMRQGLEEGAYEDAASTGLDRLRAIDLVATHEGVDGGNACPVCGSALAQEDPTVEQLAHAVDSITAELDLVATSRPRRSAALTRLDAEIGRLREELRGIETALADANRLRRSQAPSVTRGEDQAFVRGRIDTTLSRLDLASQSRLQSLRDRVHTTRLRVDQLRQEIDPEAEREQLMSRLLAISADMSHWAGVLKLEHAGSTMRIDSGQLTVLTDTETGPVPMYRVGSAANWVGYHLVAHLGLHRYFVRQSRPTPHFLMLDQPSQPFYPSEAEKKGGTPASDSDREAVTRMYQLMKDVVAELSPQFQLIVVDHANLAQPWFRDAVIENWRDGAKLIPEAWPIRKNEAE